MYTERSLLDAREVRATLAHRTDVLNDVKRLPLLPDGAHVTATLLADYFEVDAVVLRRVVRKHAGELRGYGYRQLRGEELRVFVSVNLPESRVPRRQLGIFTAQAALVLAMTLDSSEVAREVRAGLLESVGAAADEVDVERAVMVRAEFPVTGEPVRVVVIEGEPWFVTVDICNLLGLGNPTQTSHAVSSGDTRTTDRRVCVFITNEGANLPTGVSAGRGERHGGPQELRALDRDLTVMSDGTVHCRHGEMEICVPAPGEDSGPPFGPSYRCPETERYGIKDSRLERPCGSVKFVEIVRRLAEPRVPQQSATPEQSGMRLSVGNVQVHGSACEIAAVLREMGVVADPRR
ncbi:hypothetical protein ACQPZG_17190 [Streptomyces sp. CA-294286]|uniref:hypothetical protein n=1 Tax=Streptomyces sp. CA-294286 TaxID=3240070 RepID=UPI003D8AF3F4